MASSANPSIDKDIVKYVKLIERLKGNIGSAEDEFERSIIDESIGRYKDLLRRKIDQTQKSSGNSNWSSGKALSVISEAAKKDKVKREKLISIYKEVKDILGNLQKDDSSNSLLKNLDKYFKCNVKETVDKKITELETVEYTVLFAGEVSAGKSSLINLILGEEILPVGLAAVSPTICEIRYGATRKIRLHYVDKEKEVEEVTLPKLDKEHKYADQLANYLDQNKDRDKGSSYKKCELFWPHDLLKEIVLVDSPGIGESEEMTSRIMDYLSKAFSFVYVLNSANAGGVQTDRLVRILKKLRQQHPVYFVSDCALFVCNKWDQVESDSSVKDPEVFKCCIIKKLQEYWPNLQPIDQVIEFSAETSALAQNAEYQYVAEQFQKLMSFFRSMMLRTLSSKLKVEYEWLQGVLVRTVYNMRAFIHHSKNDPSKPANPTNLLQVLRNLEEQNKNAIDQFEKEMQEKIKDVIKNYNDHFKSTTITERLKTWTDDECPEVEESWGKTARKINKVIRQRINLEIVRYEKQEKVVETARASLMERVLKHQDNIEYCVAKFERMMVDKAKISRFGQSTREKALHAVTSSVWFVVRLASSVIGLYIDSSRRLQKGMMLPVQELLYIRNRSDYMANEYEDFASSNLKDILSEFVTEEFNVIKENLEKIIANIQVKIAANELLVNELRNKCITNDYPLLYEQHEINCSDIIEELAMFAVQEVFASDIAIESLKWDENSLVGEGAFANVFRGKLEIQSGQGVNVAVKISRDILDKKNAHQLISEEKQLRMLQHPNIVKFLGRTLQETDKGKKVILVMELCKENLRSFLENGNPKFIPAKRPENLPQVIQDTVKRAVDVASGLEYLHKCMIVHRHLKPENILVASDNVLKIADAGLSKPVTDITGTVCGSTIYMAPEVLALEPYDALADIYSFGLILWEMWYGERVFSELPQMSLEKFSEKIKRGYRPEICIDGFCPPTPDLESLISKCWSTDPNDRLSSHECVVKLTSALKEKKKQELVASEVLGN